MVSYNSSHEVSNVELGEIENHLELITERQIEERVKIAFFNDCFVVAALYIVGKGGFF